MRVFVAGSSGVAGSAVIPALVAAGHDVTAAVRTPAKARQVVAWGAAALEVDLWDPAALRLGLKGHEAVFNFATHIPSLSRALLPGAWRENDRLRREVSGHLAAAALECGCAHFVQESIGFLYPDRRDQWIDERVEPAPTVVTRSALQAEANVARLSESGRTAAVLRFAQFYGPGSAHSADTVRLARLGIGPLVGDPDGYSSWIHQDDVGTAAVAALTAPSGIYNVGDDEPIQRRELHSLFARALGRRRLLEVGKLAATLGGRTAEAIARSQRLSHTTFTAATGWKPLVTSAREGWPALIERLVTK